MRETLLLDATLREPSAILQAVQLLESGEPVALPTETVYGLAADALNPTAAARIFEAKERPFFDPLICHLPTLDWLDRMAALPAASRVLVEQLTSRFWPGPLTLVLPRRSIVPDLVTSGLETVALRMSAHPVFQAVVSKFGRPLAAPSANRFGRISPTTAEHVRAELAGRIPLILDGGPCRHGLESTIAAVEGEGLRILRHGPITPDELRALAPLRSTETTGTVEAPGQMKSHYAPSTPMRLLVPSLSASFSADRSGFLAWQQVSPQPSFGAVEILSPTGDLREAAATLFAKLRRLDSLGLEQICWEPVPETGLGLAIMDRLRKASSVL